MAAMADDPTAHKRALARPRSNAADSARLGDGDGLAEQMASIFGVDVLPAGPAPLVDALTMAWAADALGEGVAARLLSQAAGTGTRTRARSAPRPPGGQP